VFYSAVSAMAKTTIMPDYPTPEAYANNTEVSYTIYDFLMRFALIDNEGKKPVVNMRLSPQHAKVLAMILNSNVEAYEKQLGEIVLPKREADGKV